MKGHLEEMDNLWTVGGSCGVCNMYHGMAHGVKIIQERVYYGTLAGSFVEGRL